MKKTNRGLRILMAVVFTNLAACSTIKSWFPDKGKDYQYTTEIPPLVVPPGLTDNPVFESPKTPTAANAESGPSESREQLNEESAQEMGNPQEVNQNESVLEAPEQSAFSPQVQALQPAAAGPKQTPEATAAPPEAAASAIEQPVMKESSKDSIPVDLVIYNDGETRLRIGADKTQAWHMIGKALMRNSIEVTERNQEEGIYHVVFEPDEKPVEDGSLWDEAIFLFKGFQSKGKPFTLKIIGNNQQSDVAVFDAEGNPASDKAALRMLKQILQTLKAE